MLSIKINGKEEKVSIGCRTFVCLDVLLNILESSARQVTLNGVTIGSHEFALTTVHGGDIIKTIIAHR